MTQKDNNIVSNNVSSLTTDNAFYPNWLVSPPVIHDNYSYIEKIKSQLPTILKIKKKQKL